MHKKKSGCTSRKRGGRSVRQSAAGAHLHGGFPDPGKVDISIHAATKLINGHSDLVLGLITGSNAALESVRLQAHRSGVHASPDACWLAMRGLRTLPVRVKRHEESAMRVAAWLEQHPKVRRVLIPAMQSHPGHTLWKSQFTGAAGPFTTELPACSEVTFARFIDSLALFRLGTSWGGYESLVMPAVPHRLRGQDGLEGEPRLVRFHIGLEEPEDLCADLAQAFERI